MTAIAGVVEGGTVWLGGDSANTTEDDELVIQAQSKAFQRGPFVIGGCGSVWWCEWLSQLRPPKSAGIAWFRSELTKLADLELDDDDGALVGFGGALWSCEGKSTGIYRLAGKFGAIGAGGPAAWGTLWTMQREGTWSDYGPRERLRFALECAESRYSSVRRPFRYCHT